jgi:ATP-binding cassette subfamily B protein
MTDLATYRERPYRFVGRFVGAYGRLHFAIVLAVFMAVLCSVSTQYAVKFMVDALSGPAAQSQIWVGFAFLAGLIAADNCLWRVATWMANTAFVDVSGRVRRELFSYLTGHAPSFFQRQSPGSLASRVSATANAIYTGETMLTFNVLPPLIATLISVAYMASVSVLMATVLTTAGLVIGSFIFYWARKARPLHYAFADAAAEVDGHMVDVVSNMTLVKSFGRLSAEHQRLRGIVGKELITRKRSLYYLERLRIFHAVATSIFTVLVLYWVLILWREGQATAGDVILVCTLGISILSATRDLAVALVDIAQHLARLAEALDTLLAPHALPVVQDPASGLQPKGQIDFEGVHFRYSDGTPVLRDVSFRIEAGERVAIIGPSGSGKSTLFSLLQHFEEAKAGAVKIDGRDVRAISDRALRSAISVVSQDITLFNRTVRENVRYGRPGASDEEIWQALERAHCHLFVSALANGLDTVVGDRGANLSGGQRQRLAIARAFLKDAPILLLDEATSALDTKLEELVREALGQLMEGRTVLAITHRLSILGNFKRVIVMRDGAVAEDGSPEALFSVDGVYKGMVELERRRMKEVGVAA